MLGNTILLIAAINENSQLLSTLLPDPQIPEDQKPMIKARIDRNKLVIRGVIENIGSEVPHA